MIFGLFLSATVAAAPPQDQAALNAWWTGAGDIWLGETAYTLGSRPLQFSDGMCDFTLEEGALIPVYSGVAPVSERMIGLVWIGDGELSMRFVERGDVWRFANHLATTGSVPEAELRPLLGGAPFTTGIDRGVILSADPAVLSLLEGLQPMGAGAVYGGDGTADETYVVTQIRGGGRTRMVGINLLEDRLRDLQRSGLDPQVMLRQDRLLHEELQVDGAQLRALADFRTDTPMHVAALEGPVVGANNFDRWVSCYRDGQDTLDTGYQAAVFAHGVDQDQQRHFMRLTGQPAAPAGTPERPAFAPVRADTAVEVTPHMRGLERTMSVSSTLTVRAEGGPLQHITMRMPTGDAVLGSWQLEALELDGQPLRWVGLSASLDGGTRGSSVDPQAAASENAIDRSTSATLASGGVNISGNAASGGTVSRSSSYIGTLAESQLPTAGPNGENNALYEQLAFFQTPYRYEIMAILPEPVPAGEERTVTVTWTGRYRFSRYSSVVLSQSAGEDIPATPRTMYRPLGHTTGAQPLLPAMMPSVDRLWDYTVEASARRGLSAIEIVASGDTVASGHDEGTGAPFVRTEGQAAQPVVGVGRWVTQADAPAEGLPGVQVHLRPQTARGEKGQLAPELRRITLFMQQQLPAYPHDEIELYQMIRGTPMEVLQANAHPTYPGVVELQTVISPTITSAGLIRGEYPEFTRYQLAHQIAAQYWGALIQPESDRDAWITDGLAGTYAALYIHAASGADAYDAHMAALQKRLEAPREYTVGRGGNTPWKKAGVQRPLSLTDPMLSDVPAHIRADYATYVLIELLRPQLGDAAFFETLKGIAAAHTDGSALSTAELQAAFETASGQDLSGFFDFWVHNGRLPSLSLAWTEQGGRVTGCLTSDMPFGQLQVPVSITDDTGTVSAPLQVIDGVAVFESEGRSGRVSVALDPDHQILAMDRSVRQERGGSCLDGYSSVE